MFWIVTCFMYPRVFTTEGSCGDCCLSCGSTKYFGPRAPQSFNPALVCGALLAWGGWAPAWEVGPADLLVRALGYPRDIVGIGMALRTRHMGVLKFPGTVLVACRRKGSLTSDLATCCPVQDSLAQGILD